MRLLAVTAAALALAGNASAATYYVSAAGSDSNAGTSAAAPWRTVGKVDNTRFAPGDTILFRGGDTFTDSTLMPNNSGTATAPITFSSYGSGRATISNPNGAVWFAGESWLVFDNLYLTTGGSSIGIFAGSTDAPSTNITLRNSVVTNTAGIGVLAPHRGDSGWTISNNTITNTGDSAVILVGSNMRVERNTIAHAGSNASIAWGKHGVYLKGPDSIVANNDISDITNGQAVSIRAHGDRIYGNSIHDTGAAFAFFDYDLGAPPQGTSYVYDNAAWNISRYAFYYDGQLDPNGNAPTVDFVLASNTFSMANAPEAVNVGPSGSAHVTLVNDIFTGSYGSALTAAATTVEHHNDWYGASYNVPNGVGDRALAPALAAAPALTLPALSLLIDAGSANVPLAYAPTCNGTPLSYCGAAPDLGAHEAGAIVTAPAAPAPTPVNLLTNGSFEGTLSGWAGTDATLSLAADGVSGSGAVRVKYAASSGSFLLYASPRPVQKTVAGAKYTLGGSVRSDSPGRKLCLRVREYSSGGTLLAQKDSCLTSTSSWQPFAPLAYTAQQSGGSLTFHIVASSAVARDSFEADALTLTQS